MPIQDNTVNTQHAVPQNIMDVQFKLIGDLTMRQFFYLLVFSVIAYLSYISNIPALFRWPTIIISSALGLGFAFVPIEDRGLDEWIISFFKAVYGENQMLWKKEARPPSAFLYENLSIVKQEMITLAPTSSRRKLEHYLEYETDSVGDPLDIPEQKYIQKVREAFAPVTGVEVTTTTPLSNVPSETLTASKTAQPPIIHKAPAAIKTPPKNLRAADVRVDVAKKPFQKPKKRPTKANKTTYFNPITPDRHSGRKFTNLVGAEGNIILPIKGERTLGNAAPPVDDNTIEKAEQLKAFMAQMKTKTPAATFKKAPTAPNAEIVPKTSVTNSAHSPLPTPKTPNTLIGGVRDIQGNGIPGILLIIKSPKEGPVRAIKTDALGNFSISTPLQNGQYKIETDINKVSGFSFDIITLEAKGEIISPIKFVGK